MHFAERHVNVLASTKPAGPQHSRHRRDRRDIASLVGHEIEGQSQWLAVWQAGEVHRSTHGIDDDVLRAPVAIRPGLAKVRDGGHHHAWVEWLKVHIAQT